VDVYVGNVKVLTCRAGLYRADLERAGKGDGCCSFEVQIPEPVASGSTIRVTFAGTGVAVPLEDIQPDSGELEYYVGSHTLEDYQFDGKDKWMPFRSTEYDRYVASLHERSQARGLERHEFRPRKGDALIWSADLARWQQGRLERRDTQESRHTLLSRIEPTGLRRRRRGAAPASNRGGRVRHHPTPRLRLGRRRYRYSAARGARRLNTRMPRTSASAASIAR
jgi:hypothetical protein